MGKHCAIKSAKWAKLDKLDAELENCIYITYKYCTDSVYDSYTDSKLLKLVECLQLISI